MGVNVLPGDVGDEFLVPELIAIQDEALFGLLALVAVAAGAEEDAKFERHVEAWQPVLRVETGAADVVDAIAALLDQGHDLVDARAASVIDFAGATRGETATHDGEHLCIEEFLIAAIEW